MSDVLAKFIKSIEFSPSRTSKRPSYIDPNLLAPSTTHVYIRINKRQPPLYPAYMGPYQIIKRHAKYFEVNMRTHIDRVSIDRLKPAYLSIDTLNRDASIVVRSPESSPMTADHHSPFIDATHQNPSSPMMSPQVHTRRGRRVQMPSRFSEYETNF